MELSEARGRLFAVGGGDIKAGDAPLLKEFVKMAKGPKARLVVMTNVSPDHMGQDGIESVEDLLFIKSLVAERVRGGGTLVLNADDPLLARLGEHPRVAKLSRRVVYFSLREEHAVIRRHLDAGGTAYFMRGGWVVEAEGAERRPLVSADAVPATMGGAAEFQLANLLACAAACRARGVAAELLASALATFVGVAQNPGRANLFRLPAGGYVLLDYGHNPEAFRAVCRMAGRWQGLRVTGIVGVPGDRSDELIEEAGRAAARGFSRVVVREDEDLRGRAPGEVAELLRRAVLREAPGRECVVTPNPTEALRRELARLGPGEVVVMFYEQLSPALRLLEEHGAEPADRIEGLVVRDEELLAAAAAAGDARAVPFVRPRPVVAPAAFDQTAHDWQGYIWR